MFLVKVVDNLVVVIEVEGFTSLDWTLSTFCHIRSSVAIILCKAYHMDTCESNSKETSDLERRLLLEDRMSVQNASSII